MNAPGALCAGERAEHDHTVCCFALRARQRARLRALLARHHLERLDRARRVLGEKHPTTMNLMSLMAGDYRMLNQLEKAEALALRVLELRRSTLGEEHPMTVGSICILANIYVRQQQFDKAGPLTEQALTLCRRLPLEKSVFLAGVGLPRTRQGCRGWHSL